MPQRPGPILRVALRAPRALYRRRLGSLLGRRGFSCWSTSAVPVASDTKRSSRVGVGLEGADTPGDDAAQAS